VSLKSLLLTKHFAQECKKANIVTPSLCPAPSAEEKEKEIYFDGASKVLPKVQCFNR
jgi:hypothetical protein